MEETEIRYPWWVQVWTYNMQSRQYAMILPWVAGFFGIIGLMWLLTGNLESFTWKGNETFYLCVILGIWNYMAVRWVDHSGNWEEVAVRKPSWTIRLIQLVFILGLVLSSFDIGERLGSWIS